MFIVQKYYSCHFGLKCLYFRPYDFYASKISIDERGVKCLKESCFFLIAFLKTSNYDTLANSILAKQSSFFDHDNHRKLYGLLVPHFPVGQMAMITFGHLK